MSGAWGQARQIGRFSLVRREGPPPAGVVLGITLLALAAAFAAGGFVFLGYGIHPVRAYAAILTGMFADGYGLAQAVRRAIPLLLIASGLVLAFRAQFWNIGAEGQLLAGAAAAGGVALFVPLPGPLLLPALFVAGALAGALWGLVPALLRGRLGVNEVITTLMMNYVAIYAVDGLVHGPWKGKQVWGFPYSDTFPREAWLPVVPGTQVHWPTLLLGLMVAGALTFLLARTRLGYELRVVGESPDAARYAGIDAGRVVLLVMLVSGGVAGLAGAGEVLGIHHRLIAAPQISLGYGYTAVIVALLARGSPLATVLSSLLFGFLFASSDLMKTALQMPSQVTNLFNGLILFFVLATEPAMRFRLQRAAGKEAPWTQEAGSKVGS